MATIEAVELTEEQAVDELRELIALAGRVLDAARPVDERRRQMHADAAEFASRCEKVRASEGFMTPLALWGVEKLGPLIDEDLGQETMENLIRDVDEVRELLEVALRRIGDVRAEGA